MIDKFKLILAAAAAAVAVSCNNPDQPSSEGAELSFLGTIADSHAGIISWKSGDRIGVSATGAAGKFENLPYETTSEGAQADFTACGQAIVHTGQPLDIIAVFPYSESAGCRIPDEYDGEPDLRELPWCARLKNLRLTGGNRKPRIAFSPAFALLDVRVSSETGDISLKSMTLTVDGGYLACEDGTMESAEQGVVAGDKGSASIRIRFKSPAPVGKEPLSVLIPVLSGNGGRTLTLDGELEDGSRVEMSRYVIPAQGLSPGTTSNVGFRRISEGSDLDALETANTYVVSKAGAAYSFNVKVKGNGRARSFEWNDDQRAAGKDIVRGWSENDLAISPAKVGVLWYDSPEKDGQCPIDIESLELTGDGRAVFTTAQPFVEGNVVIAAYDAAGKILWSWTIWAVEGWNPEDGAVQVGTYTLMDRNLGAIAGAEVINGSRKSELAIGNYYQWGRKDPLPAAASYSENGWGVPAHAADGSLIFGSDASENTLALETVLGTSFTPEEAVEEAVRNPHRWMSSGTGADNIASSEYSWLSHIEKNDPAARPVFKYLWGCVDGINVEKTIYDPCPPGWTVPSIDALALPLHFAKPNGKGDYFEKFGLYFPYAGLRRAATKAGMISDVRTQHMGSASVDILKPITVTGNNSMSLSDGFIGDAYQIRCVRKEDSNVQVGAASADPMDSSHPRCALMGDSVTEQWYTPLDDNRGRVEFFTENNFIGKGISGHASGTMLNRFMKDIIALEPQCVSISAGLNDIWSVDKMGRNTWDMVSNMAIMASVSYQYAGRTIIALCTPTNFRFKDGKFKPELGLRVNDLNRMLIPLADSHGWPYADYFTPLVDENNDLKLELSHEEDDRVHPNRAGYLIMEPILLDAVSRAFAR